MRQESQRVARGYGAGLDPDPTLVTEPEDNGWTHYKRASKIVTDYNIRCENSVRIHGTDGLTKVCNCLLAKRATRPYTLACRRCKHETIREAEE